MSLKQTRRRIRRKYSQENIQLKKIFFQNINISSCFYCKYVFLINNLTIEHLTPRSFGGTNEQDNIVLACVLCNQKKGKESWKLKREQNKQLYK